MRTALISMLVFCFVNIHVLWTQDATVPQAPEKWILDLQSADPTTREEASQNLRKYYEENWLAIIQEMAWHRDFSSLFPDSELKLIVEDLEKIENTFRRAQDYRSDKYAKAHYRSIDTLEKKLADMREKVEELQRVYDYEQEKRKEPSTAKKESEDDNASAILKIRTSMSKDAQISPKTVPLLLSFLRSEDAHERMQAMYVLVALPSQVFEIVLPEILHFFLSENLSCPNPKVRYHTAYVMSKKNLRLDLLGPWWQQQNPDTFAHTCAYLQLALTTGNLHTAAHLTRTLENETAQNQLIMAEMLSEFGIGTAVPYLFSLSRSQEKRIANRASGCLSEFFATRDWQQVERIWPIINSFWRSHVTRHWQIVKRLDSLQMNSFEGSLEELRQILETHLCANVVLTSAADGCKVIRWQQEQGSGSEMIGKALAPLGLVMRCCEGILYIGRAEEFFDMSVLLPSNPNEHLLWQQIRQKVSVYIEDAPVTQAMQNVSQMLGSGKVFILPEVRNRSLSLKLHQVSAEEALYAILRRTNLRAAFHCGFLVIGTRDKISQLETFVLPWWIDLLQKPAMDIPLPADNESIEHFVMFPFLDREKRESSNSRLETVRRFMCREQVEYTSSSHNFNTALTTLLPAQTELKFIELKEVKPYIVVSHWNWDKDALDTMARRVPTMHLRATRVEILNLLAMIAGLDLQVSSQYDQDKVVVSVFLRRKK